ncbi:MAG: NAD-dependent deacylase, partial [Sphingomicrobium sp.]
DVCTPGAFARDPALVHQFYDARRARAAEVEPNPAHFALARLESEWDGEVLLVTQNVDALHERAGSRNLIHMHGALNRGWCLDCDERFDWEGLMSANGNLCPACGTARKVRPDIVWFGEMPYQMERIEEALRGCDLLVSIGTSGAVYPAAGFVQTAKYVGAASLEINLEPSQGSIFFDELRYGPAGIEVPKWVGELL